LVAVAVMVPATLEGLATFTVSTPLPQVGGSLAAAPDEVSWVLTGHIVAYSLMLPLADWLSSLVGRKRFFFQATLVFALASALAAAAPSLPVLIFARVVQGLAGGCLVPISQSVMMEIFPGRARAMALAVWSVGVTSGAIAGPTVGGFIADRWDWRFIFTFNVPLALLALPLIQLALFDLPAPATHPPPRDRRDLAGLVALVVGVGTLQTVLEWGGRADWFRSPLITWCALVAVVGLVLFVGHELRAPAPVISLRVFRNRTFTVGALFMAVAGCCQSSSVVLASLYSARVLEHPALATGLALAPAGVATAAAMLLAGVLQPTVGSRPLIVAGVLLAAVGLVQQSWLTPAAELGQVAAARIVVGLGFGLLFVALATFTLSDLSPTEVRRAAGVFNLLRNVGASVGIALLRTVLERGVQGHHARLVEPMQPYRSEVAHQAQGLAALLAARGSDPFTAQQQAWAALHRTTGTQAWFLSFLDCYRLLAVVLLLTLPLLLLSRRRST
jgi:DHA2 family multidrug resistance protein